MEPEIDMLNNKCRKQMWRIIDQVCKGDYIPSEGLGLIQEYFSEQIRSATMGVNYYVVRNRPTTEPPIHIGKSSIGWLFLFQSHNETWKTPSVVWNTYEQVKEWLKKYTVDNENFVIIDETDEVISFEEFFEMIDNKQTDGFCLSNSDNFAHCRNVNGYRFTDECFS